MALAEPVPARNISMSLPFIVSTDKQKVDPETRRLIRSHVMRGKNRVKPRRKYQGSSQTNEIKAQSVPFNEPVRPPSVPRQFCSKFSGVSFADDVHPALIEDVLSFSCMSSKAMFLLNDCIASEAGGRAQAWFTSMLLDPVYLYTMCFTVQTYFDGLLARTRSVEAERTDRVYYAKTLKILQERFACDSDSLRLSDSTMMTVLALSGHAYTTGDYKSADNHSRGLLKLVRMRGVDEIFQNTELAIEVIRCDLCMAIDSGSRPVLITHNERLQPLAITPASAAAISGSIHTRKLRDDTDNIESKLDYLMITVWAAVSEFCALVNAATKDGRAKLTRKSFLNSMTSIMYSLLHQQYAAGSLDEAFRLGILAFLSPIFLHWNRVELPDRRFTSAYREALAGINLDESDIAPREYLWLLMVAAISMSHELDSIAWLAPRLRMSIELCGVFTWNSMHDMLNSVLWVEKLYDKPGREMFDMILSQRVFGTATLHNTGN